MSHTLYTSGVYMDALRQETRAGLAEFHRVDSRADGVLVARRTARLRRRAGDGAASGRRSTLIRASGRRRRPRFRLIVCIRATDHRAPVSIAGSVAI